MMARLNFCSLLACLSSAPDVVRRLKLACFSVACSEFSFRNRSKAFLHTHQWPLAHVSVWNCRWAPALLFLTFPMAHGQHLLSSSGMVGCLSDKFWLQNAGNRAADTT